MNKASWPEQCPLWAKSGHCAVQSPCPLSPESGHVQCTRDVRFVPIADILAQSITSSARPSSDVGTVRPSIRAVCALITSSNLLDCTIGNSAGFAPLRMRPT